MASQTDWFNEARYGMFIHWGAYAVAARGEWVMNREKIPVPEYIRRYVDRFGAENYDPREWARLAREAGMKYVVLTTRHHDGFCLWDTQTTEYNAARLGPKRDLVRPFVDAVREAGLRVGFYYSVADWSHPDYPSPFARDWPTGWPDESKRRRFVEYYFSQLQELMTQYGKIDVLWYDGCIPEPTDGADVNKWIKTVQPEILINNRNGEPCAFWCSEQEVHPPKDPLRSWEACMTLNDNWGYHAGDDHYKTAKEVVMLLTRTAESAGNLLLNVGPLPDGTIPQKSENVLKDVGEWLAVNGEFLSGSTRSPFSWNNWGRLTTKGSRIYVHVFHSPGHELCLADMGNRVVSASLLASGERLSFKQLGDRVLICGLPVPLSDPIATTIVLEVEGDPRASFEQPATQVG